MNGRVLTDDIRRMAYNAILYSKKSSSNKGDTLWIMGLKGLRVVSTDDWIIITDSCPSEDFSGSHYQRLSYGDLRSLETYLSKFQDPYYSLELLPGEHIGVDRVREYDLVAADQLVFEPDNGAKATLIEAVAIHPDRLRRLGLVKPGGYPIDIKAFKDSQEEDVLAFRIGPTVRGLIAPLDRQTQLEKYTGEEVWR